MPGRIDLKIPKRLLDRYRAGLVTLDDLAAHFRVSPHTVARNLRDLGVDTSMRTRKREQFARKVEAERASRPAPPTPHSPPVTAGARASGPSAANWE